MRRTVVLRLRPDRETEKRLRELCDLASRLWNEITYVRRRQFFEKRGVDLRGTYKAFYEKYKKLLGSVTTQQVLNKNDEAWRSFFALLKLKKEGRLPPHIEKINPPGYKKRSRRKRKLWVVLRKDQYRIEGRTIYVRCVGPFGPLRIEFSGRIHIDGEQGRAEIWYDSDRRRWYIAITFTVKRKIVDGEWREVPLKPRGNLAAGIDIGVNNLMAIYVENGTSFLVNGRPLKAEAFYWRKRIASYKSMLDKQMGRPSTSRRLRAMYRRWRLRAKHYIDSAVRKVMRTLYELGVSRVFVGYPKYIARNVSGNPRINFEIVNAWSYRYLVERLKHVGEEYGIQVIEVDEKGTSMRCPLCGEIHRNARVFRGLYVCPRHRKAMNADIVAAFNILIRGLGRSITPSLHGLATPRPLEVGVTPPRPGAGA